MAPVRIALTQTGLLDPAQLTHWSERKREAIRQAISRAMRSESKPIQANAQQAMRTAFKVRKTAFIRSLRVKVYNQKAHRFPALWVGSKIPWLGIHTTGGVIQPSGKKMLIPLLPEHQRIGPKAFRQVISGLMAAGNAYFVPKGDRVILMAEVIRDNSRELSRFKRAERARTGAKSIRQGTEIPIAVLVPQVRMQRRFDLEGAVKRHTPLLVQAILREIAAIR